LHGGLAGAELYDLSTSTFRATAAYAGAGGCDPCAPATLLADGNVLFVAQRPAQLYDPGSETFKPTGTMIVPSHSTSILLANGKVFLLVAWMTAGRPKPNSTIQRLVRSCPRARWLRGGSGSIWVPLTLGRECTPMTIGSRFGEWRVCWLGGWSRHRLSYFVMVVRVSNPIQHRSLA
jgi:hypothetical protein